MKLLSLSPLPDADGFVRYTIAQPENGIQGIGKLDYIPKHKHIPSCSVCSRAMAISHSTRRRITSMPPGTAGYRDSRSGTLGHTYVMNANTVVHTQFTGAHQIADIRTDFPLTTADLGVDLTPMGNHIDISMVEAVFRLTRRCMRYASAAAASNCCMTGTCQ